MVVENLLVLIVRVVAGIKVFLEPQDPSESTLISRRFIAVWLVSSSFIFLSIWIMLL